MSKEVKTTTVNKLSLDLNLFGKTFSSRRLASTLIFFTCLKYGSVQRKLIERIVRHFLDLKYMGTDFCHAYRTGLLGTERKIGRSVPVVVTSLGLEYIEEHFGMTVDKVKQMSFARLSAMLIKQGCERNPYVTEKDTKLVDILNLIDVPKKASKKHTNHLSSPVKKVARLKVTA